MDDAIAAIVDWLGVTDDLDQRQIRAIVNELGADGGLALGRRAARGRVPMALFITLARRKISRRRWPQVFFSRGPRGEFSRHIPPRGYDR